LRPANTNPAPRPAHAQSGGPHRVHPEGKGPVDPRTATLLARGACEPQPRNPGTESGVGGCGIIAGAETQQWEANMDWAPALGERVPPER